uniref:Uncharacterized protein n=1 Tax=Plectus sambesii TaxID=2011161 RepID=A0A914WAV2_9BILA
MGQIQTDQTLPTPLYIITCFLLIKIIKDFIEVLLKQVLPASYKPLLHLIVPSSVAYYMSTLTEDFALFHTYPRVLQVSNPIKRQVHACGIPAKISIIQFTMPMDWEAGWHQLASFLGALICLTAKPDDGRNQDAIWEACMSNPHYVQNHHGELNKLRQACLAANQGNLHYPLMHDFAMPLPPYKPTPSKSLQLAQQNNVNQAASFNEQQPVCYASTDIRYNADSKPP